MNPIAHEVPYYIGCDDLLDDMFSDDPNDADYWLDDDDSWFTTISGGLCHLYPILDCVGFVVDEFQWLRPNDFGYGNLAFGVAYMHYGIDPNDLTCCCCYLGVTPHEHCINNGWCNECINAIPEHDELFSSSL